MSDHVSFQDAPLPAPDANKVERGPISVPRTSECADGDLEVSARLIDAIRGHSGAAIMWLDARDDDGLIQVIIFARDEAALDEIEKDLSG